MRVISQLADMDLEVGSIRREGNVLVVRTAEGASIPSRIDIQPRDAVHILKIALRSWGALTYLPLLPILYWRARKDPMKADINNPWSGT